MVVPPDVADLRDPRSWRLARWAAPGGSDLEQLDRLAVDVGEEVPFLADFGGGSIACEHVPESLLHVM